MKIGLYRPLSVIAGRTSALTLRVTTSEIRVRKRSCPANPRTAEQQIVRACFQQSLRLWGQLPAQQRQPWNDHARDDKVNSRGLPGRVRGMDIFRQASMLLQAAGLSAMPEGGPGERPEPPEAIEVMPASNEHELVFRVEHEQYTPECYLLLVRVTPPTGSPSRMPRECDLRYARGWGGASAVELPASGGVVRMQGVRWAIPDGANFGLEVRLLSRGNGMASLPVMMPARQQITPAAAQPSTSGKPTEVPQDPPCWAGEPWPKVYWRGAYTRLNHMKWRREPTVDDLISQAPT